MYMCIMYMLSYSYASMQAELSGKLKYSDPKRVLLDSMTGHGIVYNVVVKDTTTGTMSSYIPGTCTCTLMRNYILMHYNVRYMNHVWCQ